MGGWVNRQRSRRDKLSPTELDKLNSLGFEWSIKPDEEVWDENFSDALEWLSKIGEINHKEMIANPEGAKNYKWLIKQRVKYKAGKLNASQIQHMETSIKGWSWSPKRGKKTAN